MKYLKHIRTVSYGNQTKSYGKYLCRCGKAKVIRDDHVRSGRTITCGCAYKEAKKIHGKCHTKVYRIWCSMRSRIKNPVKFPHYVGVTVCKKWEKFKNFYEDMGDLPSEKHSLDRVNPFGNYEPANCRWATSTEQMLNQRKNRHIYQEYLALKPKVGYSMYRTRIRGGWDKVKAAHTPKMKNQFG